MFKKNKFIFLMVLIILSCFLQGCRKHKCIEGEWVKPDNIECETEYEIYKKCVKCDKTLITDILFIEHDIQVNNTKPTCTGEGCITKKCKNCNYEEKEILAPSGHDYLYEKKDATCTSDGFVKTFCSICDYVNLEIVEIIEHNLIKNEVNASCIEDGYIEYNCSNCSYSKKDILNATGHNFTYEIKYATCEEEGYTKTLCTNCEYVNIEVINKLNHNILENEVKPSCVEEGYIEYNCSNCSYSKKDILNAIGHDFVYETKDATCDEEGYTKTICTNCDYYDIELLNIIGHDIVETKNDSSCVETGFIERSCTKCSYYNYEVIPLKEHEIEVEIVEAKCNYNGYKKESCKNCTYEKKENYQATGHDYIYEDVEPGCLEDGYHKESCSKCDYVWISKKAATGHQNVDEVIEREATVELYGIKNLECKDCFTVIKTVEYVNNGFSHHGKLSVSGTDLVDENGEKFQLIGLSTHGLQWAGKYVNYDTFKALRETFGINVIRLSLYTSENGYCTGSAEQKEKLYNLVVKGIEYATELDMYVVIDWHMLGADDHADENPLYYLDESMDFFDKITTLYKDNKNLLFEIMNEPSGDTTWKDCKDYANKVIPVIRKNNDGIVLVGNPQWSSDLDSVMKDPLTGYENIMYTYHFYAADHSDTSRVIRAYAAGIPVFITEHGGMESSGDGSINFDYIKNWYKVLNYRNISYIAWNISNTKGSASILKYNNTTLTEFNSENMKAWGVYYRARVRERFGLPI